MITGIGVDSIEIERVKRACESEHFRARCYAPEEMELFYQTGNRFRAERAAGNWAVKEAVAKAFGTGFRTIALTEIIVLRDSLGKPVVRLSGEAAKVADALGIDVIHASITNTRTEATAFAVAEHLETTEQT